MKQATPPLFLERFGLIVTISLFKAESLSFFSLAPITEVFVNCARERISSMFGKVLYGFLIYQLSLSKLI